VARRYPLTGQKPRRTQVRFVLDDALLRFWFRFIFPHKSYITQRGPAQSYATFVQPQLEAWAGQGFERLCRASLPTLLAREGISAGVEVGQYWDPTVQIDVVGVRDDGVTELGECKWAAWARPSCSASWWRRWLATRTPRTTRCGSTRS
jgi:hypothetical protein